MFSFWFLLPFAPWNENLVNAQDCADIFLSLSFGLRKMWPRWGFSAWSLFQVAGADQSSMFNLPYSNLSAFVMYLFSRSWAQFGIMLLQVLGSIFFMVLFLRRTIGLKFGAVVLGSLIFTLGRLDTRMYHVNMLYGFLWFPLVPWVITEALRRTSWSAFKKYALVALAGTFYGYSSHVAISSPFAAVMALIVLVSILDRNFLAAIPFYAVFWLAVGLVQIPMIYSLILNIRESTRLSQPVALADLDQTAFVNSFNFFSKYKHWWVFLCLSPFVSFDKRLFRQLAAVSISLATVIILSAKSNYVIAKSLGINFDATRFVWIFPFCQAWLLSVLISGVFDGIRLNHTSWIKRVPGALRFSAILVSLAFFSFQVSRHVNLLHRQVREEVFQRQAEVGFRPFGAVYEVESFKRFSDFVLKSPDPARSILIGTDIWRGRTTEFDPAVLNSYGLETLDGYNNFYPGRFLKFWLSLIHPTIVKDPAINSMLLDNPKEFKVFFRSGSKIEDVVSAPLLSLANVKYVLTPGKVFVETNQFSDITNEVLGKIDFSEPDPPLDELVQRSRRGEYAGHPLRIYQNRLVFPRAFFINKIRMFASSEELQQALKSSDSEELKTAVYIDKEDISDSLSDLYRGSGESIFQAIQPVCSLPSDEVYDIQQESEGFLVVSGNLMPGWTATIDDLTTNLFHAYGTFRAVYVPAGKHRVRMVYKQFWSRPFQRFCI